MLCKKGNWKISRLHFLINLAAFCQKVKSENKADEIGANKWFRCKNDEASKFLTFIHFLLLPDNLKKMLKNRCYFIVWSFMWKTRRELCEKLQELILSLLLKVAPKMVYKRYLGTIHFVDNSISPRQHCRLSILY